MDNATNDALSPLRLDEGSPFVWAHRGASAHAPENTLEAFDLADRLGAGGIELDVRLTRDAVPVVFHDRALFTDGNELYCRPRSLGSLSFVPMLIADCTWADLSAHPIVYASGRRATLTRLEEVLEVVPASLWIDVEIKAGRDVDERLVDIAASCVAKRPDRVLVSSFDHVVLRDFAKAAPDIPRLAICHARAVDPATLVAQIPTTMICVDRPFLSLTDVRIWRELGLEVSVGALDPRFDIEEVLEWPIASIFLDDPLLAHRGPIPS